MNKEIVAHTERNISLPFYKKEVFTIFNNMDENGDHHSKCNNPDTKRQILHSLPYI